MPKHDDKSGMYWVRAWYDDRDAGHLFGPFDKQDEAEECVVVLASRDNVRSAKIEEENR